MLVAGTFLFSATSIIAGVTNSFYLFAAMRMALGMFSAFINTPIYKMIADNFKPGQRARANAIENTGYYFGGGLASLLVIIIKNYGWRNMYLFLGGAGIFLSFLMQIFIKPSPIE